MKKMHDDINILHNISNKSIFIVGIVKNIGKTIDLDYRRLTEAFSDFKDINFFVVESGSSDNSLSMLENLTSKKSNFKFASIDFFNHLTRTENMALARNTYLEYIRKANVLNDNTFVVIADFNNLNRKLNQAAVKSCWANENWDVVTANQSGRYYDIWALRHPLWSPNDCWEVLDFYRNHVKFPELALTYSLRSRMIKISRESKWIPVESAFGGIAIYRSTVLKTPAIYSGRVTDHLPICEHVTFHHLLRENGARIFINPKFINTRITDHSRRFSLLYTALRILRYPFKISRIGR